MTYPLKVFGTMMMLYMIGSLTIMATADNHVSNVWLAASFIGFILGAIMYRWPEKEGDATRGVAIMAGALALIPDLPWYVILIGSAVLGVTTVRHAHRLTPTLHTALRLWEAAIVIMVLIAMNMISSMLTYALHTENFQRASMILVAIIILIIIVWALRPHPEHWLKRPKGNWRMRHDRYNQQ